VQAPFCTCGTAWNGCDPAAQKALEHALDDIAVAEDNRHNLGHGAPLMGQQDHLVAQAEILEAFSSGVLPSPA
jgi:hypothetical protein